MSNKNKCGTLFLLLMLSACGQSDTGVSPSARTLVPAASAVPSGTTSYTVDDDMYIYVHSMQERVAKAKVIVLGTVIEQGEVINLSRDVEDRTKPAPTTFGIGQVYHITVAKYLKGKGPDLINVLNAEGSLSVVDPQTVTAADIERMKKASSLTPLEIGATYLFFLDPLTGVDFQGTYYTGGAGAIYPWRLRVNQVGVFNPEGPNGSSAGEAGPDFSPRKLDELLPQIEQLVQAEGQK